MLESAPPGLRLAGGRRFGTRHGAIGGHGALQAGLIVLLEGAPATRSLVRDGGFGSRFGRGRGRRSGGRGGRGRGSRLRCDRGRRRRFGGRSAAGDQ